MLPLRPAGGAMDVLGKASDSDGSSCSTMLHGPHAAASSCLAGPFDGTDGGISRCHGCDMGNVLVGGIFVLLGDQSDADAVLLLGLDTEQHGLGCQVFNASRRVGLRGEVFERRAALGGLSKQLGGCLEGSPDAEQVGLGVAHCAGLVVGQLPQAWNDSGVGSFGESNAWRR